VEKKSINGGNMFSNWKNKIIIMVGGLIVTLTCLLFFAITRDRTPVQWVSFIFILYAECLVTGILILIREFSNKTDKIMSVVGITAVTAVYAVVSMIVSFVFLTGSIDSISSLVIVQLILAILAAIIVVVFIAFTKLASDKDKSILHASASVKQNYDDIAILISNEKYVNYKDRLNRIYESLKYCNNAVYVPSDDKIALKIVELENVFSDNSDNQKDKADEVINEITVLIKKRELEAQNANRGGT